MYIRLLFVRSTYIYGNRFEGAGTRFGFSLSTFLILVMLFLCPPLYVTRVTLSLNHPHTIIHTHTQHIQILYHTTGIFTCANSQVYENYVGKEQSNVSLQELEKVYFVYVRSDLDLYGVYLLSCTSG